MKLGKMKSVVASLFVGGALCGNALAGETLFSNYVYAVAPAGEYGKLWAFSRDNSYSGVTLLNFTVSDKGSIVTEKPQQEKVSDTLTAVQDGIFEDDLAERRRIPAVYAGSKLGLLLPMVAMNNEDRYLQPAGYFSIRDLRNIVEYPVDVPSAADALEKPMQYAMSGFAYDSTKQRLWIARGALGVMVHDMSGKNGAKDTTFVLNATSGELEEFKKDSELDLKKNPEIFDVRLHPKTGDLWLATAQGVWVKSSSGLKNVSESLKSSRVTGLWMGGEPLQIIAETNFKKDDNINGGLWRLYGEKAKDFSKVDFLDTAGKVQKKDIYDESDYTVGDVAFIGKTAFVLVRAVGSRMISGFLKLDSLGAHAWEQDDDGKNQWLYGYETGATDRKMTIMSMCTFPLSKNRVGLAIATEGNGVSVSADSGKTWSVILNRAKLDNNLGSVRMVPSVIAPGDGDSDVSLVSYKVGRESKVTIEVFSYDMRKVRTIVKDAVRNADPSRSSNPKEDFWDGRDDHGKDCTMGVYYVRVKDNHGHIGWGKVMTLGGNFR
ncbi:hypothetical protein SAMN05720758_0092 [Fibrobacter sp. UWB11]|nr:hypothetical protein SAMN05720758_0092 [Fibrobacter sp. UWB11]